MINDYFTFGCIFFALTQTQSLLSPLVTKSVSIYESFSALSIKTLSGTEFGSFLNIEAFPQFPFEDLFALHYEYY